VRFLFLRALAISPSRSIARLAGRRLARRTGNRSRTQDNSNDMLEPGSLFAQMEVRLKLLLYRELLGIGRCEFGKRLGNPWRKQIEVASATN
jgi:hypothetical protein